MLVINVDVKGMIWYDDYDSGDDDDMKWQYFGVTSGALCTWCQKINDDMRRYRVLYKSQFLLIFWWNSTFIFVLRENCGTTCFVCLTFVCLELKHEVQGGMWSLLWFHFPLHFSLSPIFSIQDISSDYFTCHLVGRLVVGKRGVFSSMALPHHVRHVRHPLQAGPHLLHPWTKIRDWRVRNRSSSSLSHVCQVIWNSCTGRE